MGRVASQFGILLAVVVLVAAVLAVPAWQRYGSLGLEGIAWAAGACLFPGLLVILCSSRVTGSDRSLKLLLWGTALRIGVVSLVGWIALQVRPELDIKPFYLVLAGFYCVALSVETRLLLADIQDSGNTGGDGGCKEEVRSEGGEPNQSVEVPLH